MAIPQTADDALYDGQAAAHSGNDEALYDGTSTAPSEAYDRNSTYGRKQAVIDRQRGRVNYNAKFLKDMRTPGEPGVMGSLGYAGRLGMDAMGAVSQAANFAGYGPNPNQPGTSADLGDIAAAHGASPEMANLLGGAGDPSNYLGPAANPMGAARRFALTGAGKALNATGNLAGKLSTDVLLDMPKQVADAAQASKFDFARTKYKGKYFDPMAPAQLAKEMNDLAETAIHQPASKAWENLKLNNASAIVPDVQTPIAQIDSIVQKGFLHPNEEAALTKLQNTLDPYAHLDAAVKKNYVALGGDLSNMGSTLGDVYSQLKAMGPLANKSVPVQQAVQAVRDHLATSFPEVAAANEKWKNWSAVRGALEGVFGPTEKEGFAQSLGGARGLHTSPERITHMFTDQSGTIAKHFDTLDTALGQAAPGYPGYKDEARNIALGQHFSRSAPGFKGLMVSSLAKHAIPEAGTQLTGLGISLMGGSRKNFATLSARVNSLKDFFDKPAGQFIKGTLERTQQATLDPAMKSGAQNLFNPPQGDEQTYNQ